MICRFDLVYYKVIWYYEKSFCVYKRLGKKSNLFIIPLEMKNVFV